jgi:hypothetical protein
MTKPLITFHNGDTQETIVREMNNEEYAQYLADVAAWEAKQAAEQA